MKRLIIEGDWQEVAPGEWEIAPEHGVRVAYITGAWRLNDPGNYARLISVEDVPDPLPTEPGTRFWGTYGKTKPCWWFVMSDHRDGGGVRYVSQYGIGDGHPSGIHSTSLAADRLVRLPDPEVEK